jgi:peptidoglycan/xylan/chitin deacetylase (PgdA/CDA1 family)
MPDPRNLLIKLRRRLHGVKRETKWQLGLDQTLFKKSKGARILVYHGICQNNHLKFNTLFVKLKTFEMQLRFYKKYFNIVSLDDFYQQRFNDGKFNICLTFDDGFANNYNYVLPLLEQHQVPATFFITGIRDAGYDILWNDVLAIAGKYGPAKFSFRDETFIKDHCGKYRSSATGRQLVDILRLTGFECKAELMQVLEGFKNKANNDYWLQMTEQQIKALAESKWATIGSHSYYHNDLAKTPIDLAKEELLQSKRFLEKITGKEIKSLAFPYGSYTREVVEQAKNTGFTQLLATDFLFPDDATNALLRERFTVNPFISVINQMHANISGNYE